MRLLNRYICLSCLLTCNLSFAIADDDDDAAKNDAPAANGLALSEAAGIRTQPLSASQQAPEFNAYGNVVSLEPLVALRQQYLAAQADQESAAATFQQADSGLTRTRNLHQQEIISTRRLQEQQAQWRNDKAKLNTSQYQQQSVVANSRLQWGKTLTDWFTATRNPQAEAFLSGKTQLLQISLPPNRHLPSGLKRIAVDEYGRRDQAIDAQLISKTPQVDPVTLGERYFFKISERQLPFGAHITAWIADDKQATPTSGVIIPENAVVWHLGQAFVFIKDEKQNFVRHLLPTLRSSKGGYFLHSGLEAGQEIVVSGAQTLLSQELKKLIPVEDDD